MFKANAVYHSGLTFCSIELPRYFIDYVAGEKNTLFITFENADSPGLPRMDRLRPPWGLSPLTQMGLSVMGVKPKHVDWYRGPDLHSFFRSKEFGAFSSSFSRVVFYGSSMGGYAALTFAPASPGCDVLAINPQTTLSRQEVPWETRYPHGTKQDWSGDFSDGAAGARMARRAYVAYDPLFWPDRSHVERLNVDNLVPLQIPLVGHSLPIWMHQMGVLKDLVHHVAEDTFDPKWWHRAARKRRIIPRYFTGMARVTRHTAVAEACIERARALGSLDATTFSDAVDALLQHKLWEAAAEMAIRAAEGLDHQRDNMSTLALSKSWQVAKAMFGAGRVDQAAALSRRAAVIAPGDCRFQIIEAEIALRRRDIRLAEERAREIIRLHPKLAQGYRVLGRVIWAQGRKVEALAIAREALLHDPNSFAGHYDCGNYCLTLGYLDDAVAAFERAVALLPRHREAAAKLKEACAARERLAVS